MSVLDFEDHYLLLFHNSKLSIEISRNILFESYETRSWIFDFLVCTLYKTISNHGTSLVLHLKIIFITANQSNIVYKHHFTNWHQYCQMEQHNM